MHLHEYQAKILLKDYGIPVPDFVIISNLQEAREIIHTAQWNQGVVKVQVHAGGRGKAGGVKIGKSPEELYSLVRQLLHMKIVNQQTGVEGVVAHKVLISPLVNIEKEYYLAASIDRHSAQAILIASPEGGMEIEEIAEHSPEKIKLFPILLNGTIRGYDLFELVKFMGWSGDIAEQGKAIAKAIAKAFIETDAELLEINPLVLSNQNLIALDAKLSIDDNALYRQPKIAFWYDPTQIPSNEATAKKYDLAYVALDGEIGCMVNGAGLAMATMDIINYYGGKPANFLDVGGSATEEKIAQGFKIILSDPNVKAILVNIFGGIMNCVTLAAGIIAATAEQEVHVPLIIRMEGTNVEKGCQILKDAEINIILADSLEDAAQKAVAAAREG